MTIEFQSVLPAPLSEYPHQSDSVWKRNFSLEFPAKIMLNASSGKGKTTFVHTLYGLRFDYEGQILLNGSAIKSMNLHDWIELRKSSLSVVFQDLQLFGELTLWENLLLKNQLTNHKTESEIELMLDRMGIIDKKNQTCGTLSFGQQQRVAIIRALLQPFELLLMDEPFSHLDEANASIALRIIAEETDKNNAGFILTSLGSKHNFNFDLELKL